MSGFDVYDYEMPNIRFSDEDVERVLSRQATEDERLARLAQLVERLQAEHSRLPDEERVATFAAEAARIVESTRPDEAGPVAATGHTSRPRRFNLAPRRRLATSVAAAVLLSGMTGVAVAADDAAPGDALYGLDRALENIGVGNGAGPERIAEAQTLFNDGKVEEAVSHAANAAAETAGEGAEEAADALLKAAERLEANEGETEHAEEVLSNVATMLEWMADNRGLMDNDEDPGAFGRGVADLARQISGQDNASDAAADASDRAADKAESEAEDAGPPEGVPGGPPEGVPPVDR